MFLRRDNIHYSNHPSCYIGKHDLPKTTKKRPKTILELAVNDTYTLNIAFLLFEMFL